MALFPFSFMQAQGPSYDPDAAAFFARVAAAGGTLSNTEKTATNQLVLDMKSYGIWTLMKAIYPMVGASAAACAQNLKSSSFTGTFTSGWTFASTGVTPNGTSAYMDTSLTPSISLSADNIHYGYYSRTNSAYASSSTMGSDSITDYSRLVIRRSNDQGFNVIGNTTIGLSLYTVTDSRGFFIANAPNSTTRDFLRNGSLLSAIYQVPFGINGLTNFSIYLGCFNKLGVGAEFDNKECALASIGDGLTNTQASNFYTAVQAFQTTLSRQV